MCKDFALVPEITEIMESKPATTTPIFFMKQRWSNEKNKIIPSLEVAKYSQNPCPLCPSLCSIQGQAPTLSHDCSHTSAHTHSLPCSKYLSRTKGTVLAYDFPGATSNTLHVSLLKLGVNES